jgi:hypothetical protein
MHTELRYSKAPQRSIEVVVATMIECQLIKRYEIAHTKMFMTYNMAPFRVPAWPRCHQSDPISTPTISQLVQTVRGWRTRTSTASS